MDELRANPAAPVRAEVGGMIVELRRVRPAATRGLSAADVFAAVGPWEGESHAEISAIFAEARRAGRP